MKIRTGLPHSNEELPGFFHIGSSIYLSSMRLRQKGERMELRLNRSDPGNSNLADSWQYFVLQENDLDADSVSCILAAA